MAVAPLGGPARPAFPRLWEIAQTVRAAHPGASMISAGMSGDLDEAIAEGATHVRVGTLLLGGRPPVVRQCRTRSTQCELGCLGLRYGWPHGAGGTGRADTVLVGTLA